MLRLRRKAWIGHVIRKKPGRGIPRTPFLKQVMEATRIGTYWELNMNVSGEEHQ